MRAEQFIIHDDARLWQHALTTPGPCKDQQRPFGGGDGVALRLVQP
jgi:hypothetical protein